jgi:hypothetical protein
MPLNALALRFLFTGIKEPSLNHCPFVPAPDHCPSSTKMYILKLMKLLTNRFVLMLLPEAVWNSVVSVATEDR